MSYCVVLAGSTDAFSAGLREAIKECGFALREKGQGTGLPSEPESLPIIGVASMDGLKEIELGAARPFLIYTAMALSQEDVQGLKEAGLIGVITPETPPEDIVFLLNKALFYDKMLKRNPRVPVSIPVTLVSGQKIMKSFASMLSRDGIFVMSLNPLAVNSACALSFSIPGTQKELSTGARVIYNIQVNRELSIISNPRDPFKRLVSHPGMALVFTDMPQDDRESIESYIQTII
ncbi:MAG TPA: hypothetical protein DDW94_04515 [Deltaproteobacteria bacterium]|nr:MAG: hypothetical protein A2Z79_12970 [Deltaproteobacteria bacterium GWA2_55_82]OGQ62788.1 MAG: hypothetical protein A3I81_11745 [Deltaproteobacteria bacterium RIFCSPLOWO2_02_FULL_55_12]OIJ73507.1 MAG: hypothetical protein A2V21_304040 [Deltaproteobacteria bacterium GWC2_55_46]HBG46237.1 hypothetical protein [Deltaproteobacteria bacterium]HCY10144.1 hypothetical protein [Deltaproteobacteria bacterium]